jgi:predicted GIY-YIG superfamily endonuclease
MVLSERNNMDIVYIIKNPSFKYYKIGHTKNLEDRINQLNTSVPNNYERICTFEHETKETLEAKLHTFFKEKRYNREFFDLDYSDFVDVFRIADQEGYECTYEKVVDKVTRIVVEERIVQMFAEFMRSFAEDSDVRRLIKMAFSESTEIETPSEYDEKVELLICEINQIGEKQGGSAHKDVIYNNMIDKHNVPTKTVDELMNMLKSTGTIYSPCTNHYKVA